jgi:hypothetical protein
VSQLLGLRAGLSRRAVRWWGLVPAKMPWSSPRLAAAVTARSWHGPWTGQAAQTCLAAWALACSPRSAKNSSGSLSLHIHDLRHTAVALWIAAGASPKEVARRAGHTSVRTVLDVYGHLYDEADVALRERLEAMFVPVVDTGLTDACGLSPAQGSYGPLEAVRPGGGNPA